MRPLAAHCHLGLGEAPTRAGESLPARVKVARAIDQFRVLGRAHWLPRAEAALAERA